ncbi:MAG: anti-sigma factor [Planctomycetota bacterium]|jgi:anti-sigma factor RsiW
MKDQAKQRDVEDISAWLDGELEDQHAERVKKAAGGDPTLSQIHRELQELDEILNAYTAPAAPDGLAESIIAGARRAGRRATVIRSLRWLVPAAAAAAIIIAVGLLSNRRMAPPSSPAAPMLVEGLPAKADHARHPAKASFFADFFLLEHYDTLEAIEQLEFQAEGKRPVSRP